jgi:hypothetical protein
MNGGRISWFEQPSFAGITQAGSAGMISARKTRAPRWGESTQSPCKINRLQDKEESASFCEQKEAKKLCLLWAHAVSTPQAQRK